MYDFFACHEVLDTVRVASKSLLIRLVHFQPSLRSTFYSSLTIEKCIKRRRNLHRS